MKTIGVVLAGGKSQRFGRDKLVEDIGGRAMVDVVFDVVSTVADSVYLSVSDSTDERFQHAGLREALIADLIPQGGPLGGLYSALKSVDADWVILVAGDTPWLTKNSLQQLLNARSTTVAAVAARDANGLIHPMPGCYHRSVLQVAESCLAEEVFAMKALLSRIRKVEYVTLPAADLTNVNRPEDLARNLGEPPTAR